MPPGRSAQPRFAAQVIKKIFRIRQLLPDLRQECHSGGAAAQIHPILPGPQLSLSALVQKTAQLPQIDLSAPASSSILGKNTSACLQNGFVLGTAGLLDGLAERFQAELGPDIRFYATGNLPRTIREACRTPIEYREYLITDGLYRIWQRNRKG